MDINISAYDFVMLAKKRFRDQIKVIFDVGAMDGKDAECFKQIFPEAISYAVEGLPSNFKYLMERKNIVPLQRVLNNFDGETLYHKKNINGIHGIFDRGQMYGNETLTLPCIRLDTLCKELQLTSIDMIKLDVEGATLEILQGMGDILDTLKIMHVETEDFEAFKGQSLHIDVINFLTKQGFLNTMMSKVRIGKVGFQYDSVWEKM